MTDPFPLFDLPNDCLENVLGRVGLKDLFKIWNMPIGTARSVLRYVIDNHKEKNKLLADVTIEKGWRVKYEKYDDNFSCVYLDVRISNILLHDPDIDERWKKYRDNITIRIRKSYDLATGCQSYSLSNRGSWLLVENPYDPKGVCFKQNTDGSLERNSNYPLIIPAYFYSFAKEMLPLLKRNGYKRNKERRDDIISAINIIVNEMIN